MNQITIQKLSKKEKIKLMEELWADLSKSADQYAPPEWHKSELEKRHISVKEKKDSFTEWEIAKEEIRKNLK